MDFDPSIAHNVKKTKRTSPQDIDTVERTSTVALSFFVSHIQTHQHTNTSIGMQVNMKVTPCLNLQNDQFDIFDT